MLASKKHMVNGVLQGMWFELDDRKVYFAVRTTRQLARNDAWGISESLLRKAKDSGVEVVGVAHKRGKRYEFYMAALTDFYDDPYAIRYHQDGMRHRALPRNRFRIRPDLNLERIISAARIR